MLDFLELANLNKYDHSHTHALAHPHIHTHAHHTHTHTHTHTHARARASHGWIGLGLGVRVRVRLYPNLGSPTSQISASAEVLMPTRTRPPAPVSCSREGGCAAIFAVRVELIGRETGSRKTDRQIDRHT